MKIILVGIGGALGRAIYAISREQNVEIIAGVDAMADSLDFPVPLYKNILDCKEKADAIIDFSRPTSLASILEYATKTNTPAVLATTGYTAEQQESVDNASKKVAIFQSSNMSLGVNLLINLAKQATEFLGLDYEIEIIEKHHNRKVDAPSGTALSIAKELNETRDNSLNFVYGRNLESGKRERADIGLHAIRGGNIVGEHDVMFIGGEEIITLSHTAQSRSVFALGAIRASKFIAGKSPAKYDMNDLISSMFANK